MTNDNSYQKTGLCILNHKHSPQIRCASCVKVSKPAIADRVVRHKSDRAAQFAEPVKMPAHFVTGS
jgi:hypothetical protein